MTIDRAVIFQEQIPEPYVLLVEVSHPFLDEPIRAVTNSSDVVSNGNTYLASRIGITVPTAGSDIQKAGIRVANVDRRIGLAAQRLLTPATIKLDVIDARVPDTIERDYVPLRLTDITGNAVEVAGNLEGWLRLLEPVTKYRATKTFCPGLYV